LEGHILQQVGQPTQEVEGQLTTYLMRCVWAAAGTVGLSPVLGRLTGTTLRLPRAATSGGASSVTTWK